MMKISLKSKAPDIYRKVSYAQSGEDLIVKFLLNAMQIENPSYVDIGAHHPHYLNNTAIFYEVGARGINIEPDPTLFKEFLKERPKDTNLNIGVSPSDSSMDFYIMDEPTLNTTSLKSVRDSNKVGYKLKEKIRIPTKNINTVIAKYLKHAPNFLNLDAEGLDYEILKSLDFTKYAPDILCVETVSFARTGHGIKDKKISDLLLKNGYMLYADTNINSIFAKKTSLGIKP